MLAATAAAIAPTTSAPVGISHASQKMVIRLACSAASGPSVPMFSQRKSGQPRSSSRAPGDALSKSIIATGAPSRKTKLHGERSVWRRPRPERGHSCAAPHRQCMASPTSGLPSQIGSTGPAHGDGANHGCRRMREPRQRGTEQQQPIPAKTGQRNGLPAIRSNPHRYRGRADSDG
jgi:hypothetical protein